MKDLQVTLYELFGYVLPGFPMLGGLALILWASAAPAVPAAFPHGIEAWITITVLAYFSGHIAQGVSSILAASPYNQANLFPNDLLELARSRVKKFYGISEDPGNEWLYRLCDAVVEQRAVTKDREVYIYREGFYRGLAVSLAFLALALIVRVVSGRILLDIGAGIHEVNRSSGALLCLIFLVGAALTYVRYKRFAGYRVREAVLAFLVCSGSTHRTAHAGGEDGPQNTYGKTLLS